MPQPTKPKWRWYTVKCVECNGWRYPYVIGDKPTDYVCQRCTAIRKSQARRDRERASGQRLASSNRRKRK